MCKSMSTTVRVNGNAQFNFFLVIRLNISVVTSCDSLTVTNVNLIFSSLKLENGLKKHVRNVEDSNEIIESVNLICINVITDFEVCRFIKNAKI